MQRLWNIYFFVVVISFLPQAMASTVDPSFSSVRFDNDVETPSVDGIAVQEDGKIVVIGSFELVNGVQRVGVARLNSDGTLDPSFDASFARASTLGSFYRSVAIDTNGKIIIGGRFFTPGSLSMTQVSILRLNSDGSVDPSFNTQILPLGVGGVVNSDSAFVNKLELQEDGKIVISGKFTEVDGEPRRSIARLNADGSVDVEFDVPNVMASGVPFIPGKAHLQDDQKIIVTGRFSEALSGGSSASAASVFGIIRLNNDATIDDSFVLAPIFADSNISSITTIEIQPDNKLIIGGDFSLGINSERRNRLIRLNEDGSIDDSFRQFVDGVPRIRQVLRAGMTGRLVVTAELLRGPFSRVSDMFGGAFTSGVSLLESNGIAVPNFRPLEFRSINSVSKFLPLENKVLITGFGRDEPFNNRIVMQRYSLQATQPEPFCFVIPLDPALNARGEGEFEKWLIFLTQELDKYNQANPDKPAAPFAVNQIVFKSNARLQEDMELCVKYKVPIIITSLGANEQVNEAAHSYGGVVMHDVINQRFARKAIEKGADGLICVAAGAGGHAGALSPFAIIQETREWFDGPIALSGCIARGDSVLAAQAMGADFAYIGSAFIATQEANAAMAYKNMVVDSHASDIVYSNYFTGVSGNYLKPSIAAAGMDPDDLPEGDIAAMQKLTDQQSDAKAWKDIWGCGQGIGAVNEIQTVADRVAQLGAEYTAAKARLSLS